MIQLMEEAANMNHDGREQRLSVSFTRMARRSLHIPSVLLIIAVAFISFALVPPAFAEDNLPPGVPVPEWAAHNRVRFLPGPAQRAEVLAAHEHEAAMLEPQLGTSALTPFCFNGAKLCYWGGPIQHEPQLYLIFWGDKFQQGPPATLERSALLDIYESLEANKGTEGQKHWQYIISQYFDSEG